MKSGLYRFVAIGFALLGVSTQLHATSIYGVWSDPVLVGTAADASTGALTLYNDEGTAVDSITTTHTTGDTISWGTYLDLSGQNACSTVAFPCQSTVIFTGSTVPSNPLNPFQIGTVTFTNGTSTLGTIIFGATLTFFESNSVNPIGSDFVDFASTLNDGTMAQDADYVTFSGLAGKSFNVYEGDTSVAGLTGYIDDLVLTGITPLDANGFVGDSPTLPTGVPEPASLALLGTALVGLRVVRRRRVKDLR